MYIDKLKLIHICPCIIAIKILEKVNKNVKSMQKTELSLLDFYPSYIDIEELENELDNCTLEYSDSLLEQLNAAITSLTGQEFAAPKYEKKAIDFYNEFLTQKLEFLKSGQGYMSGLESDGDKCPFIHNYEVNKESNLYKYNIELDYNQITKAIKKWFDDYMSLNQKLEKFSEDMVEGDAASFNKQCELFILALKKKVEFLGKEVVKVGIKDWGMRMSVFPVEDKSFPSFVKQIDGISVIPHPLTMDYESKALIPFYLELIGKIDISNFFFVNKPYDINDIEIQWVVSKYSIKNMYNIDNEILTTEMREKLTETEVLIFNKIYESLDDSMIFNGKTELKKSIVDILYWSIRKVAYNLEEETFIKNGATEFLNKNKGKTYIKMEDDFFLPIIYKDMYEIFGRSRVEKKPERCNGEIDILFDGKIPIELKVWKDNNKNTIDEVINEKFPFVNQAASYAKINRIALLLILDVSNLGNGITNIENCWKVFVKGFDLNSEMNTNIIVFIFDCNYGRPSSLK